MADYGMEGPAELARRLGTSTQNVLNWMGRDAPTKLAEDALSDAFPEIRLEWIKRGDEPRGHGPRRNGRLKRSGPRADTGSPPPAPSLPAFVQMIDSVEFQPGEGSRVVGQSVRDGRRAPELPDGVPARYWDVLVPSDTLKRSRGVSAGSPLDVQPVDDFVADGLYIVAFDAVPKLCYVERMLNGGYVFKTDDFVYFADPKGGKWIDRDSQLPAAFAFWGRVLRITDTVAVALYGGQAGGDGEGR